MITLFGSLPCTINPPIITLSPVCTKERVEMLPSRATGVGVGVAVTVGVEVAVAVAVGVGVRVAVAVEVATGVTVGVTVAVGLELTAGVGVGVACGVSLTSLTSQYLPTLLMKKAEKGEPPQTIISVLVQTAVGASRCSGAFVKLVAVQLSVTGLYLPPVFKW